MSLDRLTRARTGRLRPSELGFTLVEVMAAGALLLVALLGFARAVTSGMGSVQASQQTSIAAQVARQAMERVSEFTDGSFAELFATFNADQADDPGGVGTAPGPHFSAGPLLPRAGDPDGLVGEIVFPVGGAGGAELREDVAGIDLDGDGVIDTADHASDYQLLPVTIRLEWTAYGRDRELELRTILCSR